MLFGSIWFIFCDLVESLVRINAKECTMSATLKRVKSSPSAGKPVWAAVGVFVVAVLALGAALIHVQTQPEEPHAAVLDVTVPPVSTPAAALAEKPADEK